MNIDNSQISFGAKFISKAAVRKFCYENNKYSDNEVSFVKLNPKSLKDLKSLKEVVSDWGEDSFAYDICIDASCMLRENPEDGAIFALTKQEKGFSNLDAKSILGLVETVNDADNSLFIEYLQTNPKYLNQIKSSEIKGIGTSILNCLKELYKNKKLSLMSVESSGVETFYKKNGFVPDPAIKQHFEWQA